ncbi:tetratricopeptide repeat protein [Brumimicrobium glaciale]|uniref:Tetratricopeptide repeat protein n=1 Tax=Brumimicrobium glaciale TaxID=200475 RepID=A0A4V1WF64_9FLAO|nr:tetratricopeptide repeat protein [Brumimicrobium glaciale]RYM32106.1 tetratricopeptide repeat protein [Brumimicrobium glaciale]
MSAITELELNELIKKYKEDSTNLDLINEIAIGYFENHEMKNGDEDLEFFELAYKLKRTIKSTHNYAWFLYFEWSEIEWRVNEDNAIEKAILIQKECLEFKPKSYLPYYQYGYMLLDQKRYEDAIPFLIEALAIKKDIRIINNLGFCYFNSENYETAKIYFEEVVKIQDVDNLNLYNLALTYFHLDDLLGVKRIAEKLKDKIKPSDDIEFNFGEIVAVYEIGFLYFLIGEYESAIECLLKQDIREFDLFDFIELSYSLYLIDRVKWNLLIKNLVDEKMVLLKEIESGHEDWDEYSVEEKKERIQDLKEEILIGEEALIDKFNLPIPNLKDHIIPEYAGCLLFDCKRHGNIKNDQ